MAPAQPVNTSTHTEPLEKWVERIIETTILKHQAKCPLPKRVEAVELRLAYLVGYMIGSGIIGGAGGAILAKAFGL